MEVGRRKTYHGAMSTLDYKARNNAVEVELCGMYGNRVTYPHPWNTASSNLLDGSLSGELLFHCGSCQ